MPMFSFRSQILSLMRPPFCERKLSPRNPSGFFSLTESFGSRIYGFVSERQPLREGRQSRVLFKALYRSKPSLLLPPKGGSRSRGLGARGLHPYRSGQDRVGIKLPRLTPAPQCEIRFKTRPPGRLAVGRLFTVSTVAGISGGDSPSWALRPKSFSKKP